MMKAYLPAEMAAEDVRRFIDEAIKETGAASVKDMGNVMKAVRDRVAGRADGKLVSELVKEKLGAL